MLPTDRVHLAPTPPASRGFEAWVTTVAFVVGALLFGALASGVGGAPMRMHPGLAWLLRAFIVLLFGSLSLGSALGAWRSLRGRPPLPRELASRCLACGTACSASEACPTCEQPPTERGSIAAVESGSWVDEFVTALGAASLPCLGVFVAIGPFLEGERRAWVLVATTALALLILPVGVVLLFGKLADLARRVRSDDLVTLAWVTPERSISGAARARRRQLVSLEARGERWQTLPSHDGADTGYRDARDERVARVLATLAEAGILDLVEVRAWTWRFASGAVEAQSSSREVRARLAAGTQWREGGLFEVVAAQLGPVLAAGHGEAGLPLHALRDKLLGRAALLEAWEWQAGRLAEAGVTASAARVTTLAVELGRATT
jgi:hypothetical protein